MLGEHPWFAMPCPGGFAWDHCLGIECGVKDDRGCLFARAVRLDESPPDDVGNDPDHARTE